MGGVGLLLTPVRGIQVRRGTVKLFDNEYFALELLAHGRREVTVRYDPNNLGIIYIYDEHDQFICKAGTAELKPFMASEEEIRQAIHAKVEYKIRTHSGGAS